MASSLAGLESVNDSTRRLFLREKGSFSFLALTFIRVLNVRMFSSLGYHLQYSPDLLNANITLSQILSIQEKGVSAWSFDPD
jgi:hypothetical protein